jgi:hypothetical protein
MMIHGLTVRKVSTPTTVRISAVESLRAQGRKVFKRWEWRQVHKQGARIAIFPSQIDGLVG